MQKRHEDIVRLAKQYGKGFFIEAFDQEGNFQPTHKSLRFCSQKDFNRFDLSEKNAGLGWAIEKELEKYDYDSRYLLVTDVNRIFQMVRLVPFDEPFHYKYAISDTVRNYRKVRQNMITGDIVRLKQPYKVDDFRFNKQFLAALSNENDSDYDLSDRLYQEWQGFTFGIVNQVLSKDLDGSPRRVSLFLYYPQDNGVWLTYPCVRNVPTFVDFNVNELELYHLSSASTFSEGFVGNGQKS